MPTVKVFLTVDTEISAPLGQAWRERGLDYEKSRDIDGMTTAGSRGVPYQIETLDRHGLKADFFVESLFASAVGIDRLREIVVPIVAAGHGVQLHVHPEWLGRMGRLGQDASIPQFHWQLDEATQESMLAEALQNLRAAGAPHVCAFRAGSFGAGPETLRCLARLGVAVDTSYCSRFLNRACRLDTGAPVTAATSMDGVVEVPITSFEGWPGPPRPLSFSGCSWGELRAMLDQAWRLRYPSVVILSHGFEFLVRPRPRAGLAEPLVMVQRRFERLCDFLAANRDRFVTCRFQDVAPASLIPERPPPVLRSHLPRTAWRSVEQLIMRWKSA